MTYGNNSLSVDWGFFTDENMESMVKPKIQNAEIKKIISTEAYILDNGEYINLLIGSKVPADFAFEVSYISHIFTFIFLFRFWAPRPSATTR